MCIAGEPLAHIVILLATTCYTTLDSMGLTVSEAATHERVADGSRLPVVRIATVIHHAIDRRSLSRLWFPSLQYFHYEVLR